MLLQLLFIGQEALNDDDCTKAEVNRSKVLSVAQDLMYGVSGGKKWTPKHIGLGSTEVRYIRQRTRSKHLMQLFHNAGHLPELQSGFTG